MDFSLEGLISICVLYGLILVVGIVATIVVKFEGKGNSEMSLVAGRKLPIVLVICTIVVTKVCGGFVSGSSEAMADGGFLWTLAPLGTFIGLAIGGVVYAGPMRRREYITMLHPIQDRCGGFVATLVYLATLLTDMLWAAAILKSAGLAIEVVAGIDEYIGVAVTAFVVFVYVAVGQMVAVAYISILYMVVIVVGMVTLLIGVFLHDHVGQISSKTDVWVGKLTTADSPLWVDLLIAMIFGTIPWQSFFQPILSSKSVVQAKIAPLVGAGICLLFYIPPFLFGVVGQTADWGNTTFKAVPSTPEDITNMLPHVIANFTMTPVAIIGVAMIIAAVMSTVDSILMGSSAMFTQNVYRTIRKEANDIELSWLQRVVTLILGVVASVMALYVVESVYEAFILAIDLAFVIVLPQLTCALFVPGSNGYGGLVAFAVSVSLRLCSGLPAIQMDDVIKYPLYDEKNNQQVFPFRLVAFIASFLAHVIISFITHVLFLSNVCCEGLDVLDCKRENDNGFYFANSFATDNVKKISGVDNPNYTETTDLKIKNVLNGNLVSDTKEDTTRLYSSLTDILDSNGTKNEPSSTDNESDTKL